MKFFKKFFELDFFANSIAMCAFLLIAIVLCAHSVQAAEEHIKIDRYVFAISANNGGYDRPQLRYAETDAKSFASVLSQMGGVNKKNVYLVKEPTVNLLQKQIDALDKELKKEKSLNNTNQLHQEVLVYYSGHADEKGLRLGNEIYGWQEFRKRIDALNADIKIAVIDACGSGAIIRAKGGVSVPAFMVDQSSDMKGYAFITSSTQNESSQESDRLNGSFFTHSLVSGLRGAGDINGDGKVTLSESYQFAFNETLYNTQSTMGGAQHPSRDMNLVGTGDVVMTDLRQTNASIIFDENMGGRLFIRDQNGALIAELYKKSGRKMELGLPYGNYSVLLEKGSELLATNVTLEGQKRIVIAENNFGKVSPEKTVVRGEFNIDNYHMDSLSREGKFRVSVNLFDSDDKSRKGFMLGFGATHSKEVLLGSELSLFVNVARKKTEGSQYSGMVNVSTTEIDGMQISGVLNVARAANGLQAGMVNVTIEKSDAIQLGLLNVSADTSHIQVGLIDYSKRSPVQVSLLNVAEVAPVQVGLLNILDESKTQAGLMNIANNVTVQGGLLNISNKSNVQVGLLNVSAKSKKRQVGLVNFCANCEKSPIGLLNFVGNGVWSARSSVNESGAMAVSLHLGTAYFYTAIEMSREFKKGDNFKHFDDVYENGLGFGTQFGRYGSHIDLEYMFLDVYNKLDGNFASLGDDDKKLSYHHRLRLGATYELLRGVGLSVGGSLNLATIGYADKILEKPLGNWHDDFNGRKARFWPGFYAGLTIGKF